jgi:hypothetical protein
MARKFPLGQYFADFPIFWRQLRDHWVDAVMGGSTSAVVLFIVTELFGLSKAWLLIVFAVMFVIASYAAWDDVFKQVRAPSPRPDFSGSQFHYQIDGDHERPDWIKVFALLTLRNRGTPSAVDRWEMEIVPPSGAHVIQTEVGLSESQSGPGGRSGGNLLHDETSIPSGGRREGWLLYHAPKARIGNLTTDQRPAIKVSFSDMHQHRYTLSDPEGFFS